MILNIENGYCDFKGIKLPIKPMIGVIGVATKKHEDQDTATPWKHGGNMDTTDICEGASLYLPVNQYGALLALGDCHAIMGDGEICFTGCEIAAEVTLKTEVIKQKSIEWPLVETSDCTMVVASGETIDDAIESATEQAVNLMMKGLNISWEESYILASLALDIKVSQVVDPKKTVRAAIPKYLLSTEQLILYK
jgi:amidase